MSSQGVLNGMRSYTSITNDPGMSVNVTLICTLNYAT